MFAKKTSCTWSVNYCEMVTEIDEMQYTNTTHKYVGVRETSSLAASFNGSLVAKY